MKSLSVKTVVNFVTVLGIFLLVQYIGLHWLLSPELNYDEGYYIMGANRMLEGDWFLQNQSFDKPFLHPLLIALSATVFGAHYLGYRMLGWVLFSVGYWIFAAALNRLFRQSRMSFWANNIESIKIIDPKLPVDQEWSFYFLKWSLLVGLFLNPLIISNGASSMGEPYLLFLLTLILLYYPLSNTTAHRFLNSMGVAFWIKGSILIWYPLLSVFSIPKLVRGIFKNGKKLLLPLALISVVGIWYGLIGKTKLFVFRYLLDVLFSTEGSSKQNLSFMTQLIAWLEIIKTSLGAGFLFLLFVLVVLGLVVLYLEFKDWKQKKSEIQYFQLWTSRHLLAIFAAVGLFFVVVTFTKVGLMPRYLVSISPLIFYLAAVLAVLFYQKMAGWKSETLIIFLAALSVNLPFQVSDWMPPKFQGLAKLSPSLLSELPPQSTLINKIVWPTGAYVPSDLQVVEVPYDIRLNRHQVNFTFNPALFALSENSLFEGFQYHSKDNNQYCPEIEGIDKPSDRIDLETLKTQFLKSVLAVGKLEWLDLKLHPRAYNPGNAFLNEFPFVFREAHAGVEMEGTLQGTDHVMGAYPTLEIKGVFVFHRGRSLDKIWKSSGWALSLRIETLNWREKSLDLLPGMLILKQGLTWPLIPIKTTESQRPWKLEFSNTASTELIVKQIRYLDGCSLKPFDFK